MKEDKVGQVDATGHEGGKQYIHDDVLFSKCSINCTSSDSIGAIT